MLASRGLSVMLIFKPHFFQQKISYKPPQSRIFKLEFGNSRSAI